MSSTTTSSPRWPDPRARWPDNVKKLLFQIISRGRPKPEAQQLDSNNSNVSQNNNTQLNQQQTQQGLPIASNEYNFNKITARSGAASVAAFLSHLARHFQSERGAASSNDNNSKKAADEAFLLFLADLVDVACGPAGAAAIRVVFPDSDPSGADWYKKVAHASGTKATVIGGVSGAAAASAAAASTGGAAAGVAGPPTIGTGAKTIATSSVIVVPNSTSNGFVVEQCSPFAGQENAHALLLAQQPKVPSVAGAIRRKRDDDEINQHSSAAPPPIISGHFASLIAVKECPSPSLQAVLCRRPVLHLLPCCVLWLVFASLEKFLTQYDALRQTPPVRAFGAPAQLSMQQQSSSSSAVKPEAGTDAASQQFVLPPGIPSCIAFLATASGNNSSSAAGAGECWSWIWSRAAIANKLLCDGIESYARVL